MSGYEYGKYGNETHIYRNVENVLIFFNDVRERDRVECTVIIDDEDYKPTEFDHITGVVFDGDFYGFITHRGGFIHEPGDIEVKEYYDYSIEGGVPVLRIEKLKR